MACRDLTRSSKKSTELLVFRRHYSELQCAIQSPEVSAGILYAKGIIDANVRDRAQLTCITRVESNQVLLNAVEQAKKPSSSALPSVFGHSCRGTYNRPTRSVELILPPTSFQWTMRKKKRRVGTPQMDQLLSTHPASINNLLHQP